MHPLRQAALAVILLLAQAGVQAAGLTEAQVRGTVAALQELEATFGENGGEKGPPADLETLAGSQADRERALAILRRQGFDSFAQWTGVAQRVVNAYMAIKLADEQPDVEAELARARAEIAASDMTPEQKRQLLVLLEQSLDSARALAQAPAEDVATVRRLLPELDAHFGE